MPIVHLNGIDINYELEGSAVQGIVVLINGLADDLQAWDYQVKDLRKAGYSVLR